MVLEGSQTFTSEKVIAYEMGYRGQFSPRCLRIPLSTFYNTYTDIRSVSATPVTLLPLFFQNNLEGYNTGLELSGDYRLTDRWQLALRVRLSVRAASKSSPGAFDLNNAAERRPRIRPNQLFLPAHPWTCAAIGKLLSADLRWIDAVHDNNSGKIGVVPGVTSN